MRGARHENLHTDGQKNKTWDFFVLRSIIIPQRGIHHSDKGRDNISRAFKDGRKSIMRWDKKWVMLMSFWFSVFVRLSVLLYDGWFRAKCKNTSLFSHVEGEVVLKSLRGRFKRCYTGFTSSHLTEVESVQCGGQKQSSGSKKANGCAGNHVEKGIKCSQTLMSTGPDSWHCTGRTVDLQVQLVHESFPFLFFYFEFLSLSGPSYRWLLSC